jgi:glyoxylase-like metal-dependent hydrolase (beta-lactamase superfamily II)
MASFMSDLTNPFQRVKLGFTNCYLLPCPEGYLLIDTSYPHCYNRFKQKLGRLGIPLSRIKYLLLTHHHDDHAGCAASLAQESGCRIIVHRNALLPLKLGESEADIFPVNRRIKVIFGLFRVFHKEFKFPPLTLSDNDILIEQDDTKALNSIGLEGQILCTPGHSNDSISMILSTGQAFIGDAAMNFLPGSGIHYRPIYIRNIQEVYESWKKLKRCGARILYPAHGAPFPIERLEKQARWTNRGDG